MKRHCIAEFAGAVLVGAVLQLGCVSGSAGTHSIPISTFSPVLSEQGYGSLGLDTSVQGQTLKIGDREFEHGLGTHANSRIVYQLGGHFSRFESWVGVDAEMARYRQPSVVFQVFGDGKLLWESGVLRVTNVAQQVNVDLTGVRELQLSVTDAGDGISCDHADWGNAVLFYERSIPQSTSGWPADAPVSQEVKVAGLTLKFSTNGGIVGANLGGHDVRLAGCTTLAGCVPVDSPPPRTEKIGDGVKITRHLRELMSGRDVSIIDCFKPAAGSVRWEIEIVSDGAPWTAEIATELRYPVTSGTRFWTAWSDPEHQGGEWRDPLVLKPLRKMDWTYGGRSKSSAYIVFPVFTFAEPDADCGLSLVGSPEDAIVPGTRLSTTPDGLVRFRRVNYRLGGGRSVRFSMDLVPHEAGWRGGVRWLVAQYPQFFNPPNPKAGGMAGCGAYSGDENPVDVEKLRKMAFRVNWKLSDDFAYMGMFIPPVEGPDTRWTRSCDEKAPPGKPDWTRCSRMNDYARYMRTNGFHVLNYFNVTEFGKNMEKAPERSATDPELWKDPRAFLTTQLPGAIVLGGNATCYGASVVDCGDAAFREFILTQAERHIRLIPDSAGICIDRLDWLERFNPKADDGVSWVNGKPARSLCRSWIELMDRLGPKMHEADRVIFVNPLYCRVDLYRQADGIFAEYAQDGRFFNAAAMLGLRKPTLIWTFNDSLREPDADAFFQRHLYMGVYPTAPYPGNNHCITPEPGAERQYLDYGPLMDAMRGRAWVLSAHCVGVAGEMAKANLFEVPGGWVAPVVLGGTNQTVELTLAGVTGLGAVSSLQVLHPGEPAPVALQWGRKESSGLTVTVPLKRGCAMLMLERPANSIAP
jgi:hypothetical protein